MNSLSMYRPSHYAGILAVLFLLTGCKPKTDTSEAVADTLGTQDVIDTAVIDEQTENESAGGDGTIGFPDMAAEWPQGIIVYNGVSDDEKEKALKDFAPLTAVFEAAVQSLLVKDSLLMKHQEVTGEYIETLTDAADSLVFRPFELKAWNAIQDYKKWIEAGKPVKGNCPSLLELTRQTDAEDKSAEYLPEAGASRYLAHGKFFFLGGAPFIEGLRTDDGTPAQDSHGNPEIRFGLSDSENANYFLNSVYHFRNVPASVSFGGGVTRYDYGPQEVNGVGSIIHKFKEDVHVFLLTEGGVIPARLVSAEVKLFTEYGCVSNYPYYVFGCTKAIEARDILAVYVPYHAEPITSFTIKRHSNSVWTADVNEDGIADLACVYGAFAGASSDTMAVALWYVNINGTWQILDYAAQPDCT